MHTMKRLVLAACAAVVLAVVSTHPALAGSPSSSKQLRTAKVAVKTATGTLSYSDWADPEGSTGGRMSTDSLVVVDYIVYTSTAGAADENWTLQLLDDSSNMIFRCDQTVAANQSDNFFLPFPTGFPMFIATTGDGGITVVQGRAACRSGYSLSVTGPTLAGYLTIGWHMENVQDRQR